MHRPLAFFTSHFRDWPPWPIPLFAAPTDTLSGHLHSSGSIQVCIRFPSTSSNPPVTRAGLHVHLPLILTRQYNFIAVPPSVPDIQQFFLTLKQLYTSHRNTLASFDTHPTRKSKFYMPHIRPQVFGVVSYPYVCKGSI